MATRRSASIEAITRQAVESEATAPNRSTGPDDANGNGRHFVSSTLLFIVPGAVLDFVAWRTQRTTFYCAGVCPRFS